MTENFPRQWKLLPDDHAEACLVGRVWRPDVKGPSVVTLRDRQVLDISESVTTMTDLLEREDPAAVVRGLSGTIIGSLDEIVANSRHPDPQTSRPWLLAPIDLQAIKAVGVTFVVSLLERVIEERAGGDPERAAEIRCELEALIGDDLSQLVPGSPQAEALRESLLDRGAWSQYLEVGIGKDPEVFTKGQPMSAVGYGAKIGILASSTWNNPEPEVALAINSKANIVGATLANDVNLRDIEGRSALLLGKAKDNNASCAIGPFIRLFDDRFGLEDVRRMKVDLSVVGEDGFELTGQSSMAEISRDPVDLAGAVIGENHQYPDGLVLLLGTMFAPTQDRSEPGKGFTHKSNDWVHISSAKLGTLSNVVCESHNCPPWTIGTAYLMRNLSKRGLI